MGHRIVPFILLTALVVSSLASPCAQNPPSAAQTHNTQGKALADKGDFTGAIAEYREALRADPTYAPAHYNLGVALEKTGNAPAALEEYRQASQLDPRTLTFSSAYQRLRIELSTSPSPASTSPSLGEVARGLKTQRAQASSKQARVFTNDDISAGTPEEAAKGNSGKADQGESLDKAGSAKANNPEVKLSPTTIPPGITYITASEQSLHDAAERVKRVLDPGYTGNEHIFKDWVICGPFIWPALAGQGELGWRDAVDLLTRLNLNGRNKLLQGKALTNDNELSSLEWDLRRLLDREGGFILRALDQEELQVYWGIVGWNIQEPIFILQTQSHKYVMEFRQGSAVYVDDLEGLYPMR